MPTPENGESYAPIFLRFEAPDELFWRFLERWVFAVWAFRVIAGLEGIGRYFKKRHIKGNENSILKGAISALSSEKIQKKSVRTWT
jgi:hypothetical protein